MWTPSRLMHHSRIEYRLLLFAQNIKANLGGELCVFVCLIVCVAGCNKPDETFQVHCPDSIMFDLWKLRASSRLLADLLWPPHHLMPLSYPSFNSSNKLISCAATSSVMRAKRRYRTIFLNARTAAINFPDGRKSGRHNEYLHPSGTQW